MPFTCYSDLFAELKFPSSFSVEQLATGSISFGTCGTCISVNIPDPGSHNGSEELWTNDNCRYMFHSCDQRSTSVNAVSNAPWLVHAGVHPEAQRAKVRNERSEASKGVASPTMCSSSKAWESFTRAVFIIVIIGAPSTQT
jgi:hypothetical protein